MMKNILNNIINNLPSRDSLKSKRALVLWDSAVGPRIAKNTRAKYVSGGILFVVAKSSVWANQLTFLRTSLIKKLNSLLGEDYIKDIRFQTGFINIEKDLIEEEEDEDYEVNLSMQDYKEAGKLLSPIVDDDIRSSFMDFYLSYKKMINKRIGKGWKTCPYCFCIHDEEESTCSICSLSLKRVDLSTLKALLYTLPWLKYEEVSKILPGYSEIHFRATVEKLKEELKDKIDFNINKYLIDRDDDIKERSVELVTKYLALVEGKEIEELDESLLFQEFGPSIMALLC